MRRLILLLPAVLLGGCVSSVVNTAVDVVTLPVKVVSKGVDLATTSQSEADEKRGRALRKAEEDFGRRHRAWQEDCVAAKAKGWACMPEPKYEPPPAN